MISICATLPRILTATNRAVVFSIITRYSPTLAVPCDFLSRVLQMGDETVCADIYLIQASLSPMVISSFEDLLQMAAKQPEPQRMLFVFVEKGAPDDWSADNAVSFRTGSGGTLTPVVCVDKAVVDIGSFTDLTKESEATGQHWDIVLVACLAGSNGIAPSASEVDQGLQTMVDAVKTGSKLWRFLAFDRRGDPLRITA